MWRHINIRTYSSLRICINWLNCICRKISYLSYWLISYQILIMLLNLIPFSNIFLLLSSKNSFLTNLSFSGFLFLSFTRLLSFLWFILLLFDSITKGKFLSFMIIYFECQKMLFLWGIQNLVQLKLHFFKMFINVFTSFCVIFVFNSFRYILVQILLKNSNFRLLYIKIFSQIYFIVTIFNIIKF